MKTQIKLATKCIFRSSSIASIIEWKTKRLEPTLRVLKSFSISSVDRLGNLFVYLKNDRMTRLETEKKRKSPGVFTLFSEGNSDRFMEALSNKWLHRMQDIHETVEVRLKIAQLLKNWYLTHRADQWRKPNKKNKKKVPLIQHTLEELEGKE